jgi:copper homeostasis protein
MASDLDNASSRQIETLWPELGRKISLPTGRTLEIAVTTPAEARLAEQGGADRLELSSGLELGGLTPSLNTFGAVRESIGIPIVVLLRPRPGGFKYSDDEFDIMCRDAQEFLQAGADGVVFGILDHEGIDRRRCKQLLQIAEGRAVFHRAFDLLPNPLAALHELIALGFSRLLTSGGRATAATGASRLATLVESAGRQIEIVAAGGIRPHNVGALLLQTGCQHIHSSARNSVLDQPHFDSTELATSLGLDPAGHRLTTHSDWVVGLRSEMDRLVHDRARDDTTAVAQDRHDC